MTDQPESGPFRYPARADRRHGPGGYADYDSYRPFLRDEFSFRCAYCLVRERRGRVTGEFDTDHFLAHAQRPDLSTEYENLLYACHSCNLRKGGRELPGTFHGLTAESVEVDPGGQARGLNDFARRVITVMGLNSPKMVRRRLLWMRIIDLARNFDQSTHRDLMSNPDDLPDLSSLRPPRNSKPGGIAGSFFARRQRGELPETYTS